MLYSLQCWRNSCCYLNTSVRKLGRRRKSLFIPNRRRTSCSKCKNVGIHRPPEETTTSHWVFIFPWSSWQESRNIVRTWLVFRRRARRAIEILRVRRLVNGKSRFSSFTTTNFPIRHCNQRMIGYQNTINNEIVMNRERCGWQVSIKFCM